MWLEHVESHLIIGWALFVQSGQIMFGWFLFINGIATVVTMASHGN